MDKHQVAIDTFNRLASAYQDKYMYLDLYNDTYDLFCKLMEKQNPEVIEVACGPGNITKQLLARRPDLRITATDAAPNMVELAKANNPTAECRVMDGRDLGKLSRTYDAVMCGFCLPYLTKEDAHQLIMDSAAIVNPGGVLYISTMEGRNEDSRLETGSNGVDKIFMHYHQEDYLSTWFRESGFRIEQVIRKTFEKPDGTSSTDLILIGKKE